MKKNLRGNIGIKKIFFALIINRKISSEFLMSCQRNYQDKLTKMEGMGTKELGISVLGKLPEYDSRSDIRQFVKQINKCS